MPRLPALAHAAIRSATAHHPPPTTLRPCRMEILFELLVYAAEFAAEIALQLAFEWMAGRGVRGVGQVRDARRARKASPARPDVSPAFAVLGYAALGAVIGVISLWPFPHSFLLPYPARLANLIVTPVIAGALMSFIGGRRQLSGQPLIRLDRFAYGVVFAFAMSLVRFLCARQGG